MQQVNVDGPGSVVHLYTENHGWLQAWLYARLGNSADAADLAQEVFLRLLQRPITTLDNTAKARAYLKVMARNLATDMWRKRELEQAWLETLANRPQAYAPSAEQQVEILQALQEVDNMLRKLPARVSKAFLLSIVCGMTEREAAAEMGVSTRTVRKLATQAMLHCMELEMRLDLETGNNPT